MPFVTPQYDVADSASASRVPHSRHSDHPLYAPLPSFPPRINDSSALRPDTATIRPDESPSFEEIKYLCRLENQDSRQVQPQIIAEIEKGFFMSADGEWTCYRRNYFAVTCSYLLEPSHNSELYVVHHDDASDLPLRKRVKAISMCLRAKIAGPIDQSIKIIQHTPKRDKGPSLPVLPVALRPASNNPKRSTSYISPERPAPGSPKMLKLPLQDDIAERSDSDLTTHMFERVQFRSATANNGKRRAQQQYFLIVVELLCDIRRDGESDAVWIAIAHRQSVPLVVRGRSPSHYTIERGRAMFSSEYYKLVQPPPLAVGPPPVSLPLDSAPGYGPGYGAQGLPRVPDQSPDASSIINVLKSSNDREFLDESSVSSDDSQTGSSRAPTRTSMTSALDIASATDKIASLLLQSDGIRELLKMCFSLDPNDRAERNIRRLLKKFSVKLKSESSQHLEVYMARVSKSHCRRIAKALRDFCGPTPPGIARLPLYTIPTAHNYAMERFLGSQKTDYSGTDNQTGKGDQSDPLPAKIDYPSASKGSIYQSISINEGAHPNESEPTGFEQAIQDMLTRDLDEKANDIELSSDSSDAASDIVLPTDKQGISDTLTAQQLEFVRTSEALEEFREDLLDLCVGLLNARHNKEIEEQGSKGNAWVRGWTWGLQAIEFRYLWQVCLRYIKKNFRPRLKPNMRRIEWTCECSEDLFADFQDDDSTGIDKLHAALLAESTPTGNISNPANPASPTTGVSPPPATSYTSQPQQQSSSPKIPEIALGAFPGTTETEPNPQPRYLAICSSAGGIYKCLSELEISHIKSDAQLFESVTNAYHTLCTWRWPWKILLKPISVEFVQLSVWDIRKGYVSIFDRPTCVPPKDEPDYDFSPRPLKPLPPVPPEIFIHYLNHHVDSGIPAINRFVWTPRLPTRKLKRLIDCDVPTYGWGIFIKEGPNTFFVFWMVILSVVCSVLLSILWATLRGDVQGASGLGSLVLGVHSVIMAVFMFRFADQH